MSLTWQIILALAGLVGGAGGIAGIITALTAARKDRVDGLATVVGTLQSDYERLAEENRKVF